MLIVCILPGDITSVTQCYSTRTVQQFRSGVLGTLLDALDSIFA